MHPSPASWSRPDPRAVAPFRLASPAPAYAPSAWASPYASWQGAPRPMPARRAETPPALYVVGSFALMMVLAAVMGVVGSVAALALFDDNDGPDAPIADVSPPAASVGR